MGYEKFGWNLNPFTLKIDPKLFTGYDDQVKAAKRHIDEKHKIALITGATGSGKTTFLKWLETHTQTASKLYISKPPQQPDEFVRIFTDIFGLSFFERLFRKSPSLYTLPAYINNKLRNKQLVFLIDEAHETNRDVLEWLRVLIDQIDSVSLILAGLPSLEGKIKAELETLDQRITTRINLVSLDRDDTKELIRKRIEDAGGAGIAPFSEAAIDAIYRRTGGFPREVLKLCDKLTADASVKNLDIIEVKTVDDYREFPKPMEKLERPDVSFAPAPPSEQQIADLPYKQKQILELLSKQDWLTPSALIEQMESEKYASKGHAVRSVNNILHRLMLEGFVQREARGKAFMYALTPKVKTLFVES